MSPYNGIKVVVIAEVVIQSVLAILSIVAGEPAVGIYYHLMFWVTALVVITGFELKIRKWLCE